MRKSFLIFGFIALCSNLSSSHADEGSDFFSDGLEKIGVLARGVMAMGGIQVLRIPHTRALSPLTKAGIALLATKYAGDVVIGVQNSREYAPGRKYRTLLGYAGYKLGQQKGAVIGDMADFALTGALIGIGLSKFSNQFTKPLNPVEKFGAAALVSSVSAPIYQPFQTLRYYLQRPEPTQ